MNNANKELTPYSIENSANAHPLETYAVNRIQRLEAQVADQETYIEQLESELRNNHKKHCELMSILQPTITLTADGDIRKLNIGQSACIYCIF